VWTQFRNSLIRNASAEFGNFQGGVVSTSIKSGTNKYHGDIFEFFRNDVLNANNWGNNLYGLPKPALRWNMFGATFGGPILKNKLFVFVDYQGQRFDHPSSGGLITLFTAAERQENSLNCRERHPAIQPAPACPTEPDTISEQSNSVEHDRCGGGNLFSSGLYLCP
jgi:hypothetical protein